MCVVHIEREGRARLELHRCFRERAHAQPRPLQIEQDCNRPTRCALDRADDVQALLVLLLVVNRSDSHSDFNQESIEQNLRHTVTMQIPHDPRVVGEAVNRGQPFLIMNPESEISRAIRELVGVLVPRPAEALVAGAGAGGSTDKRRRRGIFGR